jgi:D-psicose/D-tagatose/L-ribulose 3-epimerase
VLPAFAAATRIWRDIFESPEALYTEGIKFIRAQWDAAA